MVAQTENGMSRSYDDYEELGHYIEAASDALGQAQGKLMYMFPLEDEDRRALPSKYDEHALDVRFALERLREVIAVEFDAELPELEVPPDKPSRPRPFGRGEV